MIPPIQNLPAHIAKNLVGIFFDIDDTFTLQGKIPARAFEALWQFKDEGLTESLPYTSSPQIGLLEQ